MNKQKKIVSKLNEEQTIELEKMLKESEKPRVRQRAQVIILNNQGYCIDEIAKICGIRRNTVSSIIDKWERDGLNGLEDKSHPGRPCILTESEKDLVIELAKKNPRSILTIMALLFEETGKPVSDTTIKRILKAAGFIWKRVRKSTKDKRDDEEFEKAKKEINDLKKQHKDNEIELWFFDETGFDLQPTVPYAWHKQGETIEIPSRKSKRLNVLGFLTPDNCFEPFCFESNVNTDIVIACFDAFAEREHDKNRVIIIDNASIHTSGQFLDCIQKWEKKGINLKFLPAYSPELNIIEILWRFIKYDWLPFSAYLSFNNLINEVDNILRNIGSNFKIDFAS